MNWTILSISSLATTCLLCSSVIAEVPGMSDAEEVQKLNQAVEELRRDGVANPNAENDKVSLLHEESMEESLRLLPLDGLEFYLPSLPVVDPSTSIVIPVSPEGYQRDVTRIMYNRRFRKLLVEIRNGKSEVVVPAISQALATTKSLFDHLYAKSILERPHLFLESALRESAALGAEDWHDATMEPTLPGVRLGLFALVILAAEIPGGEFASFVVSIAGEARDAREYFYKKDTGNIRARVYAVQSGLYNPLVIGSAAQLLLSEAGGEAVQELIRVPLNRYQKLGVGAYAAEADTDVVPLALLRSCQDIQFDSLLVALEKGLLGKNQSTN